ncbi:MAG: S41 family peptidase [Oligoflexales bacterium]
MISKEYVLGAMVSAGLLFAGCGQSPTGSSVKVSGIDATEAQAEITEVADKIKGLYGPLEYKEKRFGYKLDDLVAAARLSVETAQGELEAGKISGATADAKYLGAIKKLLASLEDGHVGITFPVNGTGVAAYDTGIFMIPLEGKAVIAAASGIASELGLERGDVVLAVDGKDPFEYLPLITQYEAIGNDVSDQQFIYKVLNRPFYITDLTPDVAKNPNVNVKVQKATGEELSVDVPWILKKDPTPAAPVNAAEGKFEMVVASVNDYNDAAKGSFMEMGARDPFFMSPAVINSFEIEEVTPNAANLAKYGVTLDDVTVDGKFAVYAALYKYNNKTILLVRQAGYSPALEEDKMIAAYKALLDQYDQFADVLVIDQNHNPGGSLTYEHEFFKLFINGEARNMVQFFNVDKKWYLDLLDWAATTTPGSAVDVLIRQRAGIIESAIDNKLALTRPFPLLETEMLSGHADYTWKKPILLLADELAGSCGDIFPMLMKQNGIAKILGKRTMGLGGNVEEVGTLTHSRATFRLTRGLFNTFKADGKYSDEEFVENNGVTPHYDYTHTLSDFRQGYVDYFKTVSDTALQQIPESVQ